MTKRAVDWPPPPPAPAPIFNDIEQEPEPQLSLRILLIPESEDEGGARLLISSDEGAERILADGEPLGMSDINGLIASVYVAGVRDAGGDPFAARRVIERALLGGRS